MALKLRATRPPRARLLNDSSCAPAHNTPVPLERSPPASFKRMLGSRIRHLSRVTSRQHEENHADKSYNHALNETLRCTEGGISHIRWPNQTENSERGAKAKPFTDTQGNLHECAVNSTEEDCQNPHDSDVSP